MTLMICCEKLQKYLTMQIWNFEGIAKHLFSYMSQKEQMEVH